MNGPAELMKQLSDNITSMTVLVGILGGNAAAASAISGSTDKRSSEYKAALRSVQRYQAAEKQAIGKSGKAKQGRGSVRGAAKLKAIRKAQASKLRKKTLNANAPGEVHISKTQGWRNVRTEEFNDIEPADVDAMLDAFVDGDADAAFAAFEHGIMGAYGIDSAQYIDRDVDYIDLDWS